jgi:hypothetical protein
MIFLKFHTQFSILPITITERLSFATSAMHAYRHEMSCQLAYNPRMQLGLGLTDGESVERAWSRLRKLIPLERNSSVHPFSATILFIFVVIPSSAQGDSGCLIVIYQRCKWS